MKILIIQTKIGMGDMIIYLPYIHAISKSFKQSVSLLVKKNSRASELLAEDNHVKEIITLEKDMDGFNGMFKLSSELKKRDFSKVFIFNSSLRYNVISRLAGIKSIYQYPLFRSKDNIVHSAKIFTENVTKKIVSTEPNLILRRKKNNLNKDFKNICLGISASGPTKRWGINNYIKLAEEISKKVKCKFFIAGGKKDIDLINKFKESNVGKNSLSFETLSVKETLQNISDCDLYIGNDTGWAHISVALKVKALTIFCDSPVLAYGRYSFRMTTVEPEGENNTTTHDTLGKDKISFDRVLGETFKLLN
jgi:heptosyltransferase-2|tara:strand:- start:1679 stop:2599 length:921 start_codon:yes stop_codon:yes gene_type:complete